VDQGHSLNFQVSDRSARIECYRLTTLTELQAEWHRIRVALSEMTHFARHLQAWSQLEVIECSWKNFQEFINRKEGDLDTLIEAHQTFLNRIGSKLHFRSTRPGREVGETGYIVEIPYSSNAGPGASPGSGAIPDHFAIP
jgi:hypothetical protein